MILLAYLVFALCVAAALDPNRGGATLRRHEGSVRAFTAALAAILAAGAALRLTQVVNDPQLSWADDRAPFVFPAAIALGSVLYLLSEVAPRRARNAVRSVGWVIIVLTLAFPSTLTLALPLAAVLALTLTLRPRGLITSVRGSPARPGR